MEVPRARLGEAVMSDSVMGPVIGGIYDRMSSHASDPRFPRLVREGRGNLNCAAAWDLAVREGARLVIRASGNPFGVTALSGPIGIGPETHFRLDPRRKEIRLWRAGEQDRWGAYDLYCEGAGIHLAIDSDSPNYTEAELLIAAGVGDVPNLHGMVTEVMRASRPVFHSAYAGFKARTPEGYGFIEVGKKMVGSGADIETVRSLLLIRRGGQQGMVLQTEIDEQGGMSLDFKAYSPDDLEFHNRWPDHLAGPIERYGSWLLSQCGSLMVDPKYD